MYEYVDQVTEAVRELRDEYVKWPSGERLAEVKKTFGMMGFKNAIGALDGTTMQLANAPSAHCILYRCCYKYWAVSCQIFVQLPLTSMSSI